MDQDLTKQCELFIKNRNAIKPIAHFEFPEMVLVGSSIYTFKNLEVDTERLKECSRLLKQNTGVFSEFREFNRILICCNMALSDDPQKYLDDIMGIYGNFQESKVFGSNFRLLASTIIYDALAPTSKDVVADSKKYVDKTYEIYQKMRQAHPWLTSEFSLPFATMLALSGKDVDKKVAELEKCFEQCSEVFSSSSARQILSQTLALSDGTIEEKCQKAAQLWQDLKDAGFKLGKGYAVAILGALAGIDYDEKALIKDILDIDDYLKQQKGFGIFSVESKSRHIFSVLLAINHLCAQGTTAQQIAASSAVALAIELELVILFTIMISNATISSFAAASN